MIKKRNGIILLLILCCISGCGKNSRSVENEVLTEPEYETRSIVQENETMQVYDGWERADCPANDEGIKYVYYPHVENKIKGVSYVEDSLGYATDFSVETFKSINCPVGCKSIKHKVEGCESQCNSQPQLEGSSNRKRNNLLMVVEEGEIRLGLGEGITANNDTTKWEIQTQDVQAISFAIYEDFFDTIPELTVKLYGIPTALWEGELGNTMEFSSKQYREFINQYENNNFTQFDLLTEKKIEKTDVYYIDYNDLHEKGDYIQILIVLNFDKEMPYTYRMCGDGIYEISDRAAYNEWKNKNINLFIQ